MKSWTGWGVTERPRREVAVRQGVGAFRRFSANMIEPQVLPLIGVPRSWTPGTGWNHYSRRDSGRYRLEADFAKFRGHLAGKIVLTQPVREVKTLEGIIVQRWTEPLLAEAMTMPIPSGPPPPAEGAQTRGKPSLTDPQYPAVLRPDEDMVAATFDRGSEASIVAGDKNQMSWRTQRTQTAARFSRAPRTGGKREQSRQPGAVRDARGRALQPHAAHSRQGNSGKSGTQCPDASSTTRPTAMASMWFGDLPGSDPNSRTRS